jgi:abortive infection bacteriophage resistance protein
MSIQNFVRDSSFFSNLRDRNRSISASDLDYQFASFENFLKRKNLVTNIGNEVF